VVRITKKRVVAVAGPGVATVLAVAGGSTGAGASTQSESHEFDFVTRSGDAVTCTFQTTRTWGGSDGTATVYGATRVTGGPAACYDATAYVSAAYTDASGQHVQSAETGGAGGAVSQRYAVGPGENPRTYHRLQFNDCGYADPGLCATPTYSHVGCAL
jgi:hypothetical protein